MPKHWLASSLILLALALPARGEEVRVLLDLPAPHANDLQWFPGGRFLLVSQWADDNSIHAAVVDVDNRRWKPVRWVQNRSQLGPPPWTCIHVYCHLVVSASGTGVRVEDIYSDPACKSWINDDRMANRMVPGDMLYDAADPRNIAVSASGRYALMRLMSPGDEGPVFTGFWIIRFDPGPLEEWEAWDRAIAEQRREPLVWELPGDRRVWSATWLYDPAGGPDRIAILHGDRSLFEAWLQDTGRADLVRDYEASFRLLVLEVRP